MTTVGFDFGTTNSLISILEGGRVRSFLDSQSLPIPSVVSYQGGMTIVGRDAKRALSGAGLGVQGNTVRSPKSLLGQESVFVDGVERSPIDIVADVVRFVRNSAESTEFGKHVGSMDRAVVTIPVNMNGHRRAALRDAFSRAGVTIVQYIHEPLAALFGHLKSQADQQAWIRRYEGKYLLVFDWGGGTLDLTLCRLADGMIWQRSNDGTDEVGGDVFDETIRTHVVQIALRSRGIGDDFIPTAESMARLLEKCEDAKIVLSSRQSAAIFVPQFFRGMDDPDLNVTLSRQQLEKICRDLLDKGLRRIENVLSQANLSTLEVALCLATGGMASMPAIKQRLHEWFGPQRVVVSDKGMTLISEGAAWAAHERLGLVLAKDVELLLARNVHYPLIQCGAPMPQHGEVIRHTFHFYCSDPRDGIAKFQFEMPQRPGRNVLPHEPRRVMDVLTLAVHHTAKPLRERLEVDVEIDANLVLKATARSLMQRSLAEVEIHDLEFGVRMPAAPGSPPKADDWRQEADGGDKEHGLVTRSNIAAADSDFLAIPGELLYTIDPLYFDQRRRPPAIQVEEHLYYAPCALCKRAASDPLCRCSAPAGNGVSTPSVVWRRTYLYRKGNPVP